MWTGQPNERLESACRVETARVSIYPCDELASREIAEVLADPRVGDPYWGGRPPLVWNGQAEKHWIQHVDDFERIARMNLAVRERTNGDLVGMVQFDGDELNYFVSPSYWRRGYGTEVVETCCRVLARVLNLKHLRASVIRENVPSRRILENVGFKFDGLTIRSWNGRSGSVAVLQYKLRVSKVSRGDPGYSNA